MPRLENWYITYKDESVYCPPEQQLPYLCGTVYGHNRCEDGRQVTTSRVIAGSGNKVYTASGTEYILGEPEQAYVAWCVANGKHVPTVVNPILWIHRETE